MTRFGKYELISRLAKGGMGETYLADFNAVAGVTKRVVIKKMLPSLSLVPDLVEAFVQEARISASFSHGNIAQVFDFGEIDGEYFLAMEYVHGRSLQQVLERGPKAGFPRLPFPVAAYVIIEVLKALQYAHTRTGPDGAPLNIVHRDVTPDNVLISYEGDVKLVDFGVAKSQAKGRSETEPGLVKGKYRYLSPEQALAEPLDARSDVFTAGIVLHELLTGSHLFKGQMHVVMNDIVRGTVPAPRVKAPDVPEALEEAALHALARRREDRFESARAMQESLSRWLFTMTPDFSGEVLRELMGELFEEELASAGTPFKRKAVATKMLRALKTVTATPINASPGIAAQVTERRLVAVKRPAVPLALGVAAALGVAGVAGVAVFELLPQPEAPPAYEAECIRRGEKVLLLQGSAAAVNVVTTCIGDRPASAAVRVAISDFHECQNQLDQITKALSAMNRGEFFIAGQLLPPAPKLCAREANLKARARLVELQEVLKRPIQEDPLPGEDSALCRQQLAATDVAERAMANLDLVGAKRALDFVPLECSRFAHAVASEDLETLTERVLQGAPVATAKPEPLARTRAEAHLEEARGYYKNKEYAPARQSLEKCIKADRTNAQCHKLLGATLGQLGEGAAGARAYQKFIDLAPNDPQTPKVRALLEAYRGVPK